MGTIILLLGVGSTGKTTLAKQLVDTISDEFCIMGFDHAVETHLDKKYWPGGSHEERGFCYVKSDSGPKLEIGPEGHAFLRRMFDDILIKAKSGENIIIDSVLSDYEYQKLIEYLPDCHFLKVGLKPPLESVVIRESNRSDRKSGIAKQDYVNFYTNKEFDMMIDTSATSPQTAAEMIQDMYTEQKRSIKLI